jgi:hypothetical protein
MPDVNYYYHLVETTDDAGDVDYEEASDLLHLCGCCAERLSDDVRLAQRGDNELFCEMCGTANDPDYQAEIAELVTQIIRGR